MLDHNGSNLRQDGAGVARELDALIARQPVKHSLQQEFYTSNDIYRFEIEEVLGRHWHCAGHQSQIPEPGDYLLYEFDKESVIVVRGQDGQIRALSNVCRHRGSRVCDKSGKAEGGVLICPYHAWSYGLDGSLQHARMMPRDFDNSNHGLTPIALRVVQGLLLVNLSEDPLAIDEAATLADGIFGLYDWANAKVVHQVSITFSANWKLALENQVECMHCGPAHPEFSHLHGQGLPNEAKLIADLNARCDALGLSFPIVDKWALNATPGHEMTFSDRAPMRPGVESATESGKCVAPLMGQLKVKDEGFSQYYVGPHNHFLTYSDYGASFCYVPKSVNETTLNVMWLVRADAREGVDYDLKDLTWLWEVTAAADKHIVEENHRGVDSRYYRPGPYALPIERKTARLSEWYLSEMRQAAQKKIAAG